MLRNRYALPLRLLSAVLLATIPLMGCAALSAIQQTERGQGGTWVQAPTDTPANVESQTERPEQNGDAEPNPRIHTVEVGLFEYPPPVEEVLAGPAALAATLHEEGEDWIGTRYRYGGTTRRGIDCSAFVQTIMRGALGIELPRTTATQVHRGKAVSRDELLPGDLVFFRRRGIRHVGIYLGDGEFIHASSSRGVIISNLTEGYYRRHFWKARRVIDSPHDFLAGEDLRQNTETSDVIRPGFARPSDRTPERVRTRNGNNPRESW